MTNYLIHWQSYWDRVGSAARLDPPEIPRFIHGYTGNESLYQKVKSGDNLWVIVSGGPHHPDEWRLLQYIQVERKQTGPQPQDPQFHIIGNETASHMYILDGQSDFSMMLRKFQFVTARPITAEGKLIAPIEAPRELTREDVELLEEYREQLTIDPTERWL